MKGQRGRMPKDVLGANPLTYCGRWRNHLSAARKTEMFGVKQSLVVLAATSLLVCSVGSIGSLKAQTSRTAMLQAAQSRGSRIASLPSQAYRAQQRMAAGMPAAQGSGSRIFPQSSSAPIVGTPTPSGSTSVISQDPIVGGGSPVVTDEFFSGGSMIAGGPTGVYQGVNGSCMNGGCNRGCASGVCGTQAGFAAGPPCGMVPQYCYPWGSMLFRGFNAMWRNTELFGGAQGFRSSNFVAGNQLIDDSSFGFYGGFNTHVPLQPITCGLLSGQIGVRSVQSEFDGDSFSTDNRDQLFITAALFRRVDYGLQFGVAFDFLYEEWFAESDLAQIRGDAGWVCPGGCIFGFRFATGTQDHLTSGIVNGVAFNNLLVDVVDNYRFYYRIPASNAGFCDLFAGWSEDDHAVLGLDFDMPVTGIFAMQSGFTYFLPDDQDNAPIVSRDAWNVYVGFSLRPRGAFWYRNGGRPMFNVADNGNFILRRQ